MILDIVCMRDNMRYIFMCTAIKCLHGYMAGSQSKLATGYKNHGYKNQTLTFRTKIRNETHHRQAKIRNEAP